MIISRDGYRHLLCYGTYHATIDPALKAIVNAIRPETYSSQKEVDAWGLVDTTRKTHIACFNAHEEKLTYMRRFKCKKLPTGDKRVAELLVYSKFSTGGGPER
jgi:hypothetical protein